MLKKTALVLASVLAVGCAEGADDEVEGTQDRDAELAEITENLLAAGYTEEDIEIVEMSDTIVVDGKVVMQEGPQVMVGGDIHVTLEASRELLGDVEGDDAFRLWRTPGLVTNNNTICLARATYMNTEEIGPPIFGTLTTDMSTGVHYARNNYNWTAGVGLDFQTRDGVLSINGYVVLTPAQQQGCDFIIDVVRGWGATGGQAGFPSGGVPYGLIQLKGTGSNQVFEHIATHEIGHTIGLRHSDWKTRVSCGQNINEGQSGASQIAGTADQTTNSVMSACFALNTNGEFRGEDQEALGVIY